MPGNQGNPLLPIDFTNGHRIAFEQVSTVFKGESIQKITKEIPIITAISFAILILNLLYY